VVYALEGDVSATCQKGKRVGALKTSSCLAPIQPGKIVAIGRNYVEHAKSMATTS